MFSIYPGSCCRGILQVRDWFDLQNGLGGVVFVGAGTGRSVDFPFLFKTSNLIF